MPFNWAIFPPPNPQFPHYYPSDFYMAYIKPTNVPLSTPYATGSSSLPVTTPLTAAGAAGVQEPTQPERPLTKKERKAKAKLEDKENEMAEVEAKFRLWQEEEEKKAQQEAEEAERLRMAEEEWGERKENKKLRKLNEEIEKGEEELRRLDEEVRKEEEELRKLERKEREVQTRKEREEAWAKVEEQHRLQRLRRIAEEANARFRAENQEKVSPPDLSGGSWFPFSHRPSLAPKLPGKWDLMWRVNDLNRVEYPEGIQRPSAELDHGRIMPGGKYKHVYDRDFLLQFWAVCEEKPEWASDLTGLGVEHEDPVHRLKGAFPIVTDPSNRGKMTPPNGTSFATLSQTPPDNHNSAITRGGPTPMAPSPSFPLPRRLTTIKLSNPKTGETVFLQSPDPVDAAEAAGVGRSTEPERPLTKRERKMKARWEAEEKQRAEEAEIAQKEAEEADRLRRVQAEETNPEDEEVRTLEEELRKLEEEMRKGEEEIKRREEERREAEEDLMKLEEEHWVQRNDNERAYKEREETKGKTKGDSEGQRQRLTAEMNANFGANSQEQDEELRVLGEKVREEEEELKRREEERRKAEEELRKLEEQYRIQLDRSERARKEREGGEAKTEAEEEQKHGVNHLEGLGVEGGEKVYEVRDSSSRLAGREPTRRLGLALAPSASTSTEIGTSPHSSESSVARVRPRGQDTQQLHPDVLAAGQESSRQTAAEFASRHALKTISKISRQMAMLFKEMKDLKNEVRDLRNETNIGNGRERSKSPRRQGSVSRVARTATAINQNFVTKKDELGFNPGDVVTILDAPQDMPHECLFGEINITKRGFFPFSYVNFE